jgi:sortase A
MKKINWGNLLIAVILISGISMLIYPTIGDYWNSFRSSKAISGYAENVASMTSDRYEEMLREAKIYNQMLLTRENEYALSEEQIELYEQTLDVSETGIMGYVEIPQINCSLPIYHGTEESVLQIAIGHLEWTSLPIGGENSHCVISGHRGLKSAKLFTDLDRLTEGDIFMLRVLDEVLTYEVDQISIVLPNQTEELLVVDGKDYCTLMTCTPYGVNTHRLLVRGHRIANLEERTVFVTADAMQVDPAVVAPAVAVPILLVMFLWVMMKYRK